MGDSSGPYAATRQLFAISCKNNCYHGDWSRSKGKRTTVLVTGRPRLARTHRFSSAALVQIRRSAVGNTKSNGRHCAICPARSSSVYTGLVHGANRTVGTVSTPGGTRA